jgi:hypothetical protein
MLALPVALKGPPWVRSVLLIYGLMVLAVLLPLTTSLRYTAGVFGLFFLMMVESMRYLNLWRWRGKLVGRFLVRGTLVLCVLSPIHTYSTFKWLHAEEWSAQRAAMLAQLHREDGRHLIMVRYTEEHNVHQEWVQNEADIDGAKVIWAREMDAVEDRKLFDYFKDRHIWLLEADVLPRRLVPHPAAQSN